MSLVRIYDEYTNINKEYLDFVNEVALDKNIEFNDKDLAKLNEHKNSFRQLMERINEEDLSKEDETNIKDLKYLVLDSIFLSSDLAAFYNAKEQERFKMRIANYVNKMRRAENGIEFN
ncbi:MAG: hypothetical protein ACRCVJ_06105 [Clostridium sp.]|uniref:hypothetical protein n=1 Tax=Clostridium sp. TaxID=1506 RepID=UPI003F3F82F4